MGSWKTKAPSVFTEINDLSSQVRKITIGKIFSKEKELNKNRSVSVISDLNGNKTVVIHDIIFKGKRKIDWDEVEAYLKRYVGEIYEIAEYAEKIYVGSDLPDEFTGSKDTARLRGAQAKAKANAVSGIPELIQIANHKTYKENKAEKHKNNAKLGWYRYYTRFALPVYDEKGNTDRYNVFRVEILVRHGEDGKMYLYDMINVKKETSTPLEQ